MLNPTNAFRERNSLLRPEWFFLGSLALKETSIPKNWKINEKWLSNFFCYPFSSFWFPALFAQKVCKTLIKKFFLSKDNWYKNIFHSHAPFTQRVSSSKILSSRAVVVSIAAAAAMLENVLRVGSGTLKEKLQLIFWRDEMILKGINFFVFFLFYISSRHEDDRHWLINAAHSKCWGITENFCFVFLQPRVHFLQALNQNDNVPHTLDTKYSNWKRNSTTIGTWHAEDESRSHIHWFCRSDR